MANLSSLSRKEQVHHHLRERFDQWVDGTELATAEVGGSEGLKRLRELRQELRAIGRYDIVIRAHPDADRDIYQYRLTERYAPAAPAAPEPPRQPRPSEVRRGTHLVWDPATDQYVAVYDGPPVAEEPEPVADGQTDMGVPEAQGYKFTKLPERIVLGEIIPCPLCHNVRRRSNGKLLPETRHPRKPNQVCPRCDGFGLVPAQGGTQ
jgi:hypothetical protein